MNVFDKVSKLTPNMLKIKGRILASDFGDVASEYDALRNGAIIYDCGSYGLFKIEGQSAEPFLESLSTKDVCFMNIGSISESYFLNDDGNIVGVVFIAKMENDFLVITPWEFAEDVVLWMQKQNQEYGATITDLADEHSLLSVEGCMSWRVIKDVFNTEVGNIGLHTSQEVLCFEKEAIIMRIGRTSEYGFMVFAETGIGEKVYQAVLDYAKNAEFSVMESGLACLEVAMCEIHQPNFIRETKEHGNIFELCQQWYIRFDKEDYRGVDAVRKMIELGVDRTTATFVSNSDTDIPAHTPVFNENNEKVGHVIYSIFSVRLNSWIGVAMFDNPYGQSGLELSVKLDDYCVSIRTTSAPMVRPLSWDMKMD